MRRCALEAWLSVVGTDGDWKSALKGLANELASDDRHCRWLSASIVARLNDAEANQVSAEATKLGIRAAITYAFGWLGRNMDEATRIRGIVLPLAVAALSKKESPAELKLDAIRLIQLALGDMGPSPKHQRVFDGYASGIDLEAYERELDPLRVQLAELYPTGDTTIDRELIRTLAMLTSYSSKLVDAICEKLTEDSHPIDDIHHLVVVARLPMTHSVKQRDALVKALVQLDDKIAARNLPQDSSWNDRLKECWVRIALADDYLAAAIVNHPAFGQPNHTVFLNQMPPELLSVARKAFVGKITSDPDYAWNNDVVFALGESEEKSDRQ
ncbi:MAG: hypothetical protein FJ267_20395, partial [Planctomycetes bacterium]|nr:hypothetical protein [Planctomycetota bacterium]